MGKIFGICDVPVKTFEAVWLPYRFPAYSLESSKNLAVKGLVNNLKTAPEPQKGAAESFIRRLLNPNSRHLCKTKRS